MDAGPSRLYYSTEDVVGMVVEDEERGPSAEPSHFLADPELDEPVFYGSDDEIDLVEEVVGIDFNEDETYSDEEFDE